MKSVKNISILIALIYTVLFMFSETSTYSRQLCAFSLLVCIGLIYLFVLTSKYSGIENKLIKPSNIFMTALVVVCFQTIADYVLGLRDISGSLYPNTINKCAFIGVVSIASFNAGYAHLAKKYSATEFCHKFTSVVRPNFFALAVIQLISFLMFVFGFGFSNLISGASYLGGNEAASGTIGTYGEILLYATNVAIVVLSSSQKRNASFVGYLNSFPMSTKYVFVLYILIRMLSGDRGPVIYNGLLLLYGYLYSSSRKLNIVKVSILALVAVTVINVIGIARTFDNTMSVGDKFTTAMTLYQEGGRFAMDDAYEGTCFPPTIELAGSSRVTEIAINNIECQHDIYTYGLMHFVQLMNSIPFSSNLYRMIPLRSEYFSSSARANFCFFGGYERTWGIGTNMIADFYWDFGILGVLILFFVVGLAFYKVDNVLLGSERYTFNPYWTGFALIYAAESVYIPRSTFFSLIRTVAYCAVLIYFFGGVKKKINT